MTLQVEIYLEELQYLRKIGKKTEGMITKYGKWDFRIAEGEFRVRETFYHIIQAIYEDVGRWFKEDLKRFEGSNDPRNDLDRAIDRFIESIQAFTDDDLKQKIILQWGEEVTISQAIQQEIFHAIGHFAQLRNWIGISLRRKGSMSEKTFF